MNTHNIKVTLKHYAPDILTYSGIAFGAAALYFTAKGTPKAVAHHAQYVDNMTVIMNAKETGLTATGEAYTEKDYKTDRIIETKNTAINYLKDYGVAAGCAIASAACALGSLGLLKKENAAIGAIAGATMAAYNQYRANVRAISGDTMDQTYLLGEPLKRITKAKNGDIKVEECKATDAPTAVVLDSIDNEVSEEAKTGFRKTPASLTTIKIDEDCPLFAACGGNMHTMALALKCKQDECSRLLWTNGKITYREILETLGYDRTTHKDRFNWEMADILGIIDYPVAKDIRTGKIVKVPGFSASETDEAFKYGDRSHKSVSFGPVDFSKLVNEGVDESDYETGNIVKLSNRSNDLRAYFYLDINCDGDISHLHIGNISQEEIIERCWEHPELQK